MEPQQKGIEPGLPRESDPTGVHAHTAGRIVVLHRTQHAVLCRLVQAVLAPHPRGVPAQLADGDRPNERAGVDHAHDILRQLLHQLLPVLSDGSLLSPRDTVHVPILLQRPHQATVADDGGERRPAGAADATDTVLDLRVMYGVLHELVYTRPMYIDICH